MPRMHGSAVMVDKPEKREQYPHEPEKTDHAGNGIEYRKVCTWAEYAIMKFQERITADSKQRP